MSRPPALVVDDYASMRSVVIEVLKRAGFTEIYQAGNGQSALAKVLEHPKIGLIVSDWYMPTMDGLALLRALKANPQTAHIPVLMITAEGQRDNVLDAIVTTDERGLIVSVNESTERIFGWPAQELIGQSVGVLMPPDARATHADNIGKYGADRPSRMVGQEREVLALHKDGHQFPATIAVSQVVLDNQRMLIGVVRDISERKRTEQKLRDNARQLQTYYDQTQAEQQQQGNGCQSGQFGKQGVFQGLLHGECEGSVVAPGEATMKFVR